MNYVPQGGRAISGGGGGVVSRETIGNKEHSTVTDATDGG